MISVWFYYGEISFATAASISVGKLGSTTTDIVTPILYRSTDAISLAFWIGVIFNSSAFVFIIILNLIDSINDRRRKELRYLKRTHSLMEKVNTSLSIQNKNKSNPKFSILDESDTHNS